VDATNALELELERCKDHWLQLARGGSALREEAERYYRNELFPKLQQLFAQKNQYVVEEPCEGLILSLGKSWEPLALTLAAIEPQRVLIICSPASRELLHTLKDFLSLKIKTIIHDEAVKEDEPIAVYQKISQYYEAWGRPQRLVVDFTGGTKAMTSGCAMAGALLGAQLVYISSKYNDELRRPLPGSERLVKIANPYLVFGDLEIAEGISLMRHQNYAAASQVFRRLKERIPDPRRTELLYWMTECYDAWDNMDAQRALESMQTLLSRHRQYTAAGDSMPLGQYIERLHLQERNLQSLARMLAGGGKLSPTDLKDPDRTKALMLTLWHAANRREKQGRLDMAALLLYRLLEICSQVRLASYGIDTARPDYTSPDLPVDLAASYCQVSLEVDAKRAEDQLPNPIALLNGYILLKVLNDPLAAGINLQKVRGQALNRNESIFAHGFRSLKEKKYKEFLDLVKVVFQSFSNISGFSVEGEQDGYEFICLPEHGMNREEERRH